MGCLSITISGADVITIGSGKQNTIDILRGCTSTTGIAAERCDKLELNGKNDWFLPSKDELKTMYNNLHKNGYGNFNINEYWSSSEGELYYNGKMYTPWKFRFSDGVAFTDSKTRLLNVRAVRSF